MDGSRGRLQVVVTANPAAGADYVITVPANKRWRLLHHHSRLQNSATVANRDPFFTFKDAAGNIFEAVGTNTTFAASTSTRFGVGAHGRSGTTGGNAGEEFQVPIDPLELGAGFVIASSTGALQAGDQWAEILTLVEEWDV